VNRSYFPTGHVIGGAPPDEARWRAMTVTPASGHTPQDSDPTNGLLLDRLEQRIKAAPDNPAIVTDERTVSLAELNGQANAIAVRLLDAGVPANSPVILFMTHGLDKIAAAIGVYKAASAFASIDPIHKDRGVLDLFGHTRAPVILTDRAHEARARQLAPERTAVIEVSDLLTRPVDRNPGLAARTDHMSRINFTSGSTGAPKAAMISQAFDLRNTLALMNLTKVGGGDRIAFMQGFWASDLMGPMIYGATVHPFDLREHGFGAMKHWLQRHDITCYGGILTGFRQFLTSLTSEDFFPAMRVVAVTGEALYREDVERFDRTFPRTCTFVSTLSSTEQGRMAYFVPDRSAIPPHGAVVPIGYPMPHIDLQLLDEDHNTAGPGTVGEIAVRGETLNLGYWGNPALTAKTWVPDKAMPGQRVYLTGDLAVMDENGCLHGRGRADSQVKIRGHRVLLGEIENMLTEHPAVKAAVVVLDRVALGADRLVGYVVGETDAVPTTTALRAYLGRRLPDVMVPALFVPVAGFKLTASGKIDRKALPPPKTDIRARADQAVAPANKMEAALKEIWQELLGEEEISVEDDFFLIGGDSIQALSMFVMAEQRLRRRLPFESLWLGGSTIRALAAAMSGEALKTDWSQALPLQTNGTKPVLFVVSMVSMPVYCLSLIQHLGADQPVYGLPAKGIGGDALPDRRVEDMAAHCINLMRQVQPEGPYRVMGHSAAGLVGFEIASILHAQGIEVSKLVLLDSNLPASAASVAGRVLRQPHKAARYAGSLIGQSLGVAGPDRPETLRSARASARFRYRPKPYGGSAILITSAERERRAELVARWRRLVLGGLSAAEVPGDHLAMLQGHNAEQLAAVLSQALLD